MKASAFEGRQPVRPTIAAMVVLGVVATMAAVPAAGQQDRWDVRDLAVEGGAKAKEFSSRTTVWEVSRQGASPGGPPCRRGGLRRFAEVTDSYASLAQGGNDERPWNAFV